MKGCSRNMMTANARRQHGLCCNTTWGKWLCPPHVQQAPHLHTSAHHKPSCWQSGAWHCRLVRRLRQLQHRNSSLPVPHYGSSCCCSNTKTTNTPPAWLQSCPSQGLCYPGTPSSRTSKTSRQPAACSWSCAGRRSVMAPTLGHEHPLDPKTAAV